MALSAATPENPRRRYLYFDKTVEVEIDSEDLAEAGYHHENDCPAKAHLHAATSLPVLAALAGLHQQAHPGQPADPAMCRMEPCRLLTLAQLRGEAA